MLAPEAHPWTRQGAKLDRGRCSSSPATACVAGHKRENPTHNSRGQKFDGSCGGHMNMTWRTLMVYSNRARYSIAGTYEVPRVGRAFGRDCGSRVVSCARNLTPMDSRKLFTAYSVPLGAPCAPLSAIEPTGTPSAGCVLTTKPSGPRLESLSG